MLVAFISSAVGRSIHQTLVTRYPSPT